jgi:hypothetical protein
MKRVIVVIASVLALVLVSGCAYMEGKRSPGMWGSTTTQEGPFPSSVGPLD